MPEIWVFGGSRVPDPDEHDVPVIAKTVIDRIVKAGTGSPGAREPRSGSSATGSQLQGTRARLGRDPNTITFGHCNFIHLVETTNEDIALEECRAPFIRAMGTHRPWEHLQDATWRLASTGSTRASPTSWAPG